MDYQSKPIANMVICLYCWVLSQIDTVIRSFGNFPAFIGGGGRPQVPLCALFEAKASI